MASSDVPRISAARIPAFLEAFNATVPTGTPLGICKIESTESQPSIELDDLIGTPITGNTVTEATIPGKCAAPPAPAIITFNPLSLAVAAYSIILCGVRCADTTVTSCGISKCLRISEAACITFKSLSLPIIIPTKGFM